MRGFCMVVSSHLAEMIRKIEGNGVVTCIFIILQSIIGNIDQKALDIWNNINALVSDKN